MKKVLLKSALMLTKPSSAVPESTYYQRKAMQPAYSELFRALLLLPDKDVQQRVLDAINGPKSPEATLHPRFLCMRCRRTTFATASTQTEARFRLAAVPVREQKKPLNLLVSPKKTTDIKPLNCPATPKKTVEAPQRRRRKRKICLPQVIKRSHAQQAQQTLMPKIKQRKMEKSPEKIEILAEPSLTNSSGDLEFPYGALSPAPSIDSTVLEMLSPVDHLVRTMAKEFQAAEELKDGLLPIHHAIVKNDVLSLRRQIFVWKTIKEIDLNDVLTDNEEDCLQLAAMNNSNSEVLEALLEAGLSTNCIDEYSNTIVHLALINEMELDALDKLMRSIDLETLLQLNDDGFTPLQVAVRSNLALHTELILNILDERLLGRRTYKRRDFDDFLAFYRDMCDSLDINGRPGEGPARHKLKSKLLETGEMRSGNTPLFYSIENKMEDFIYLLLAHLTDPRIQNHSGQDARSYFGEFGRVLNLTLHIDKIMEKVIGYISNL